MPKGRDLTNWSVVPARSASSEDDEAKQWSGTLEYPPGFEESDRLRSEFIRRLTLRQLLRDRSPLRGESDQTCIPRTLVQFWHDPNDVPPDVRNCMRSWDALRDEGVVLRMFDDDSAAGFIAECYGQPEVAAFARCRHPAMRSDYLRLCFVLAEGGLYVDADDVLLGDGWEAVFCNSTLKIQPLCYDVTAGFMVPAAELRRSDLPTEGRIFYVNNNPIAAPPGHPVLQRALARATARLLGNEPAPEIQSTTGPGNLTAVLAAHASESWDGEGSNMPDFELLLDWERIAEPCWELAYRNDSRNWRNMNGH
jgi:mannosyltransferase OCH1-like enzyme